MKTAAVSLILCLASVGLAGCDTQVSNVAPTKAPPSPIPGTNLGSDPKLTEQVSGWTYHLFAGQDRIAAYQFNESGTVPATVGTEGRLDYPGMFWRIDEDNQIVVADDRHFQDVAELWRIISIDESVVTVNNAANNRVEKYWRTRGGAPPSVRAEVYDTHSRNAEQTHPPEPAAGPDSNGTSSPPDR
jgi:hypothetical protein